MAETAKILNPTKTVLIPSRRRPGCSLAASITAEDVREPEARFPGVPVVTYVNIYADVKAESDVCCTSGNAAARRRSRWARTSSSSCPTSIWRGTSRARAGKRMIIPVKMPRRRARGRRHGRGLRHGGVGGRCEVHEKFSVADIQTVRTQFPDVVMLSHPECSPEVVAASDFSGSTNAMIRFVEKTDRAELPAADRMLDGRKRGGGEPGQGDAASVQRPLPAHEPDHPRNDTRRAAANAIRH